MRVRLAFFSLALCVCAISTAATLGDVARRAGAEGTDETIVGQWNFAPVYTLERNAAVAPGFNDWLSPEPAALFQPNAGAWPQFLGKRATDQHDRLLDAAAFPAGPFTLEFWILDHVDQPVGVLGGVLDASAPEDAGVFLGYHAGSLAFGLATISVEGVPAQMAVIQAEKPKPFLRRWVHAVATYDGAAMRLFANGELAASAPISGVPRLPEGGAFGVAAYLEREPHMQTGNLLRDTRVLNRALTLEEVQARYALLTTAVHEGRLLLELPHFTAGPALQVVTQDRVTLVWETDRPSTGVVKHGASAPLVDTTASTESGRLHKVTLTGLEPGRPYFYEVMATLGEAAELSSGLLSFQTAVAEDASFAFAIIGDTEARPHINDRIAKQVWGERPHFVINCGDLTDGGFLPYRFEWTHEYWTGMTQLASRVCIFPVPGNGEADLHWYNHYHALPEDLGYYSFRYGNAAFFMLDSNRPFDPDSAQYRWLEEELRRSEATWKFAVHHHPTMTSDENDYGDTWQTTSEYRDENPMKLVPLYEQYGVDVVFFGHLHSYERSWPVKDGAVNTLEGVIYVQTGGGGGNLEDAAPTRQWFMNSVHRDHHYCMVRINGNRFEFRMVDADGSLRDQFVLEK